jgi:hypothetical protein
MVSRRENTETVQPYRLCMTVELKAYERAVTRPRAGELGGIDTQYHAMPQ